MDDILSQIIAYAPDKIDTEIKARALVQGSRNMDQEPRNMYNQGSSVDHAVRTVDPVQDSGNKIEEVLKAYGRYRGNRKGKPMSFSKFFQLYAPENFATGGSAGQLVSNTVDGSRPGYNGDDVKKMSEVHKELKGKFPGVQLRFNKSDRGRRPSISITTEDSYKPLIKDIKKIYYADELDSLKTQVLETAEVLKPKMEKSAEAKKKRASTLGFYEREGVYGDRKKVVNEVNKIIEDVASSKRPITDISKLLQGELIDSPIKKTRDFTATDPRSKKPLFLTEDNMKIYKEEIFPKLRTILSRLGAKATTPENLKNLENLTVDNFDDFYEKNPSFKSKFEMPRNIGEKIISTLERHSTLGGEKFKLISGENFKDFKIKDLQTNEILTADKVNKLVEEGDPRFKEFKKVQNRVNKLKKTEYVNPVTKKKTTLFKALQLATGDLFPVHIDHIKGVRLEPLRFLTPLLSKTNIGKDAAQTVGELKKIGARSVLPGKTNAQGAIINFDKQINDLVKFADRKILQTEASGFEKPKTVKKILGEFEAHPGGCGKAAGGRILFAEGTPDGKITTCARRGIQAFIDDLKKGNYSKASLNILKGGGNILKNIVDPAEFFRLKNLIGLPAIGFMGLWEAGVITDDVIRQGTPLNESLANNWLTKTFLPYTKDYAKAKNLLESGTVPSNMKKYVKDVVTFNDMLMDIKGIEGRKDSRLVDDSFGMIDGTSMYTKEQEQKEDEALIKKAKTLTENVFTPGTAKALEMKSLQDEMEATRMAKKEFSPVSFKKMFGIQDNAYGGLKDRNLTSVFDSYISATEDAPKNFRPITYQDAEYEDKKLPLGLEQLYMNKLNLKPRDSLKNYFFKDGPKKKIVYGEREQDFAEKPISILEDLTNDYNKFERQKEASKYRGYFGANEPDKFMEGGIASLNVKK